MDVRFEGNENENEDDGGEYKDASELVQPVYDAISER